MLRFRILPILFVAALNLSACNFPRTPPPPEITQGMAEALIDTGFYTEVGITQTLGRHYEPDQDSWNIIACYQFVAADGSQGTNFIYSFDAFKMDNGVWIVSVTINEVYRWRAIAPPGVPASVAEPGTQPNESQ